MKIVYSNKSLRAIGARIVEIIFDRTAEGLDANGKPFNPYSTRPFKMPAGAIGKGVRKILIKDGKLHYFKNNKALWVVILGGYMELKRAMFRKTSWDGKPNLMATGKMLRAMKVVKVGNNRITIGFTRTEEAEKAGWNAERGREFLGITDKEWQTDPKLQELFNDIDVEL